jgi:type IV pilus assembly protein PilO
MASTIAADFGRMSGSRKVLVFVVAGALLGLLYWRFVYTPLELEVAEARGAYENTQRTHATGVANLKRYEELRPEMDKLRAQLARNQAALPTEAEVPAFFETLERKVKESGVEIAKWTKRAEEPIESFVKVPVEIEITGTFMQLKRFFASLVQKNVSPNDSEERERIVSIESLVISQPLVRNREIVLAAKFTAVTFRQEEKRAPTKPGAPPPPPPAPPPLRPGAGAQGSGADPLEKGM